MIGMTRAKTAGEFGWMQCLPAIALIGALFFGGDWAGDAAASNDAERDLHGGALSLAIHGSDALMTVAYDELEPTPGYVALPDEIAASIADRDGEAAYAVEMRISNVDVDGRLRRVEVRVGYDAVEGERTWVETATVRQDWAAAHAESQRERPMTRVPTRFAVAS